MAIRFEIDGVSNRSAAELPGLVLTRRQARQVFKLLGGDLKLPRRPDWRGRLVARMALHCLQTAKRQLHQGRLREFTAGPLDAVGLLRVVAALDRMTAVAASLKTGIAFFPVAARPPESLTPA